MAQSFQVAARNALSCARARVPSGHVPEQWGDLSFEPEGDSKRLQRSEIARPPGAEPEVRTDADGLCVAPIDQHLSCELFRGHRREGCVEVLDHDAKLRIDACDEFELSFDRCEASWGGASYSNGGMRLERESNGRATASAGIFRCARQHGAVSEMHAVEVADGNDRRSGAEVVQTRSQRSRGVQDELFQRSAWATCPSRGRWSRRGGGMRDGSTVGGESARGECICQSAHAVAAGRQRREAVAWRRCPLGLIRRADPVREAA